MKLCIDAGHGMSNKTDGVYDCGARAGGIEEADVALTWALTLRWIAQQRGVPVWLTRDDDRDPDPVGTRDDRAEAAGCTHFLSIHCNAGIDCASGTETFFRDGEDHRFAAVVHAAARDALGLPDRGIRHESLTHVGRLAVMGFDGPCALLELGYLDHKRDRARLLSRDCRIAFARSLLARLKG